MASFNFKWLRTVFVGLYVQLGGRPPIWRGGERTHILAHSALFSIFLDWGKQQTIPRNKHLLTGHCERTRIERITCGIFAFDGVSCLLWCLVLRQPRASHTHGLAPLPVTDHGTDLVQYECDFETQSTYQVSRLPSPLTCLV